MSTKSSSKRPDVKPLSSLPHNHPMHITHRHINWLLVIFSALSVIFLITTIALTEYLPDDVNSTVWSRAVTVVIVSLLYFFFAYKLRQGRRWAYTRLRLTSFLGAIGIIAIVTLPGQYPVWARVELAFQGLVLVGLAWVLTRPHVREMFS